MRIRVLEDAIFNVVSHFSLSSGAVGTVGIGEMEAVRGKEADDQSHVSGNASIVGRGTRNLHFKFILMFNSLQVSST